MNLTRYRVHQIVLRLTECYIMDFPMRLSNPIKNPCHPSIHASTAAIHKDPPLRPISRHSSDSSNCRDPSISDRKSFLETDFWSPKSVSLSVHSIYPRARIQPCDNIHFETLNFVLQAFPLLRMRPSLPCLPLHFPCPLPPL